MFWCWAGFSLFQWWSGFLGWMLVLALPHVQVSLLQGGYFGEDGRLLVTHWGSVLKPARLNRRLLWILGRYLTRQNTCFEVTIFKYLSSALVRLSRRQVSHRDLDHWHTGDT